MPKLYKIISHNIGQQPKHRGAPQSALLSKISFTTDQHDVISMLTGIPACSDYKLLAGSAEQKDDKKTPGNLHEILMFFPISPKEARKTNEFRNLSLACLFIAEHRLTIPEYMDQLKSTCENEVLENNKDKPIKDWPLDPIWQLTITALNKASNITKTFFEALSFIVIDTITTDDLDKVLQAFIDKKSQNNPINETKASIIKHLTSYGLLELDPSTHSYNLHPHAKSFTKKIPIFTMFPAASLALDLIEATSILPGSDQHIAEKFQNIAQFITEKARFIYVKALIKRFLDKIKTLDTYPKCFNYLDQQARFYFLYGLFELEAGSKEAAEKHFLELIQFTSKPDVSVRALVIGHTYFNLGKAQWDLKKFELAKENFENALKTAVSNGQRNFEFTEVDIADYYYMLGLTLVKLDKTKEANACFEKAEPTFSNPLTPSDPISLFHSLIYLGRFADEQAVNEDKRLKHNYLGFYEKSVRYFEKALKVCEGLPDSQKLNLKNKVLLEYAQVLMGQDKVEEAQIKLQEVSQEILSLASLKTYQELNELCEQYLS